MTHRAQAFIVGLPLLVAVGCDPMAGGPAAPAPPPSEVRRPAESSRAEPPRAERAGKMNVAWDTRRDQVYAEFLRDHAAGMIQDATVCVERKGVMDVLLDRSVAPEDTLELTKSLMSGVRKDFPDKPILLKIFDPSGAALLYGRFQPGQGVEYRLANETTTRTRVEQDRAEAPARPSAPPAPATSPGSSSSGTGMTEADRKFAAWAESKGKAYLRYVEADLEKRGRMWFGVTREVKPEDLKDLTRSLLEGAHREFPGRDLVATVYDPEGERVGRALLNAQGSISWQK